MEILKQKMTKMMKALREKSRIFLTSKGGQFIFTHLYRSYNRDLTYGMIDNRFT